MPCATAPPLTLTAPQRVVLAHLARAGTTPQQVARRAQLVLAAADGTSTGAIARTWESNGRGRWESTWRPAQRWRARWHTAQEALRAAEAAGGPGSWVLGTTGRSRRSSWASWASWASWRTTRGPVRRPRLPPSSSARSWRWPASHRATPGAPSVTGRHASWPMKPASEASSNASPPAPSGGSSFFEAAARKPHRSRYWLTPREADPVVLATQIDAVCTLYAAARGTGHRRAGWPRVATW